MGIYKFSLKMLKINFKQGFSYLLSVIFPIVIIFNLLNIMNNRNFNIKGQVGRFDVPGSIIFFLTLLICIFTFYANSYFVMSKSKQMAIEELSGVWPGRLAVILLFENGIIELIGCAIGIFIGILLMPEFLKLMYVVMGTNGSVFELSYSSIFETIGILIIQLGYVCIGDYGYVYSREIINLMNVNKSTHIPDTRFIKFNSRIYIITYLVPVVSLIIPMSPTKVALIGFVNMFFTVFGIQGVLRYYFPNKILELKKEKYLSDKIKLISLSNVSKSFNQLKFLVITLAVTIELLLCCIAMFQNDARIKTICIISYVAAIVMIAVSIIYKIVLDSDFKKNVFRQLILLGYSKKQLTKIIDQELQIFYGITVGIPLFHILIFFILFLKSNIISISLTAIMLCVFLITFFITFIISHRVYKKLAF
ncbi:ABC transporter permease [Clostridium sp. CT7]|nr:hypothetical protein [Clostridium sp. CT7]PJI08192.1 ABC transporter permease [Clostridium sp. CT7]